MNIDKVDALMTKIEDLEEKSHTKDKIIFNALVVIAEEKEEDFTAICSKGFKRKMVEELGIDMEYIDALIKEFWGD